MLDSQPRMRRDIAVALFVLVLVVVAPMLHPIGGQQISRYALTAAVWDQGTLEVTSYADLLVRDGAAKDGSFYSEKAPGQPLLAVPFYGMYRLAGGEPLSLERSDPDFGLWWLTVWCAGVPLALLAMLMYRWANEIEPRTALAATITMTFGTLLVVYGTLLFAHVLAGLLGFGMFLLVRSKAASRWQLMAAGAVGGLAVMVEYPLAILVAIVTAATIYLHRWRAGLVVVGGLPFALGLGLYNWYLFGSPFMVGYQWSIYSGIRDEPGAALAIFSGPSLERVVQVLFAERGLFIATPVLAIALVGVWLMWKNGWRLDAVVAVCAFLSMLAIQFMWGTAYANGAGPRYVTPGLPFMVAPVALVFQRWRRLTTVLAAVGVITLMAAMLTLPQLGSEFDAGMADWLATLFAGRVAPTVYSVWFGSWGWLLHIASVLVALTILVRLRRRGTDVDETSSVLVSR